MSDASPRPAPLAVVAIGGNALIPADAAGTSRDQVRAARRVAKGLVGVLREGYRLLVVHGNGPQVGRELLRSEESATKLPPQPLDVCVAATQGTMAYQLGLALRNVLKGSGLHAKVSAVATEVLVSQRDGAFEKPTKPIGPFYSAWRARELQRAHGWAMIEDAGRGWRRVVASPRPLELLGIDSAEALLDTGHVVIAGGGGGIPVAVDGRGELFGVEAVVDKDYTAGLFAELLGAEVLVLLTAVEAVYVDFGKPGQRRLEEVTPGQLRSLEAQGHFPPGSMGPKIDAAATFVEDGGPMAIITHADRLVAALSDRAGTRVSVTGSARWRRQLDLFGVRAATADSDPDPDPDDAGLQGAGSDFEGAPAGGSGELAGPSGGEASEGGEDRGHGPRDGADIGEARTEWSAERSEDLT